MHSQAYKYQHLSTVPCGQKVSKSHCATDQSFVAEARVCIGSVANGGYAPHQLSSKMCNGVHRDQASSERSHLKQHQCLHSAAAVCSQVRAGRDPQMSSPWASSVTFAIPARPDQFRL